MTKGELEELREIAEAIGVVDVLRVIDEVERLKHAVAWAVDGGACQHCGVEVTPDNLGFYGGREMDLPEVWCVKCELPNWGNE